MFWLQRQFNNIVETNARISLSLWMFEVSTASSNTSLQSLWEVFNRFVDRSLWQVAPDNLKRLLEFSECLRLCFKLAVSFQHCTPHYGSPLGSYPVNLETTGLWWWNLDNWSAASSVRCAALRATCVLARRPAGRWIQWAAGDCFKGRII